MKYTDAVKAGFIEDVMASPNPGEHFEIHPKAISWGEPALVPQAGKGGKLVLVRGTDAVLKSVERGEPTVPMTVVMGFEGNDGTKSLPTPEEVIDMFWKEPGWMTYDGESQRVKVDDASSPW